MGTSIMPIGSYAAVPALADTLLKCQPHSVLDLGMGFGGGGVVVREWLDLGVRPYRTYLVGVEIWADYRNAVWDLYNAVYVQTAEEFLAVNSEPFDAILLGDLVEHFDKTAGIALLAAAKQHVAPHGCLLVTTPAMFFSQQAAHGNEWECHRSAWTVEDLENMGFTVERLGQKDFACGECLFAKWTR